MVINDLNDGENSFRRLAKNLPGIVYRVLLEEDNRMIFFNDMVQTMTGYSPEDLKKGKVCTIDPLILLEDRLNVINTVKDAIENNVPFEVEYRINNKSGEVKWFFERGRPIRGDNGNPSYIDGVIFDITNQKEAEKKLKTSEESLKRLSRELEQRLDEKKIGLRESERKFKSIFLDSPIGIELYDSYGKLREANKACLDMFGVFNSREIEGFDLFSDPNIPKSEMEKLKNGKIIQYEAEFDFDKVKQFNLYETSKSGKSYLDVMITPLYIEDKQEISNYLVQVQDITERKLNEIKLEEYAEKLEFKVEERTRSLKEAEGKSDLYLNLIEVIIVALDREGKITLVNKKGLELLGYEEEELIEKNWFEVCLPPHDRERVYGYFKKLMVGELEVVKFYENSVWTKNGEERLISWSTVLFKDENGNITGLLSSGVDITERAITEQKLIESEAGYRHLSNELAVILDHLPGIVVYKDTENNILRVNKYLADAHNLDKAQMENRSSFDFYLRDIAQAYWEDDLEVINSKKPKINSVEPWETDTGKRWVNTSKIPYINENGNVKGIIAIAFDITERMLAEQKLISEKERAQNYLDIAGVIIVALNADQTIQLINKKGCEILGEEESEIIGMNWFDNYIPENVREQVKKDFNRILSGEIEPLENYENAVIIKNGKKRIIAWHNHILRNEAGQIIGTLSSGEDITERKQAERELQLERDNFLNILNSMEDGIYIVDQNYDIEFVNPSFIKEFGQFEGIKCFKYFEDRNEICPRCKNKEVFQGKTVRGEWFSFKNQKTYDLIDTPLKNPDGSISKLGIFRDETDKKQAELKLKESEEKYRKQNVFLNNILKSLTHPFYVINVEDYTISLANSTASSEGIEHGKHCYSLTHNNDKPCEAPCVCPLNEVKNTKKSCVVEHTHYDKEGNEKIYEIYGYPILDENGNVVQMIEYALNITDHKIAQQELKESEKRYRLLFESSPTGIGLSDFEGNVLAMNQKMVEMTGFTLDEFKKTNLRDLHVDINDHIRLLSKLKDVGKVRNYELKLKKKDGTIYDASLNSETLHMDGKKVFLTNQEDITERKKTEQKLKKSEENYRELFENSPISLWEEDFSELKNYIDILKNSGINDFRVYFDKNPEEVKKCVSMIKIVDTNKKTIELYKANTKEDFFAGLDKVFTEESLDTFKELIITLAGGKTRFESEAINCTINGDKLYIFLVCEIVAGFKEDWSKVLISIVDISERKKTEQALKVSEEIYRSFVENFQGIAFQGYEDYTADFFHGAVEEITGYTPEDFKSGRIKWNQLFHPEDGSKFQTQQKKFGESSQTQLEYRIKAKDGSTHWILSKTQKFYDETKKKLCSRGIFIDITDKKKAEQQLKESEQKFRTIAERTLMGILILQDNQVKYVNDALLEIFEYSQKEIINWETDDLTKLIHPENLSFLIEYRENLRMGDFNLKQYISYRVFTKLGKVKWIDQFSKEILYKDKPAELITIIDITEKKEAEQELIKLNNMKSELLRRTSHELKTPLVSIKGFSDLLLELHRDKLDNYVIRTIEQIRMGCNRLESLVNDMLKTSELESGTVELKKAKEDLSLLIKTCMSELEGLSELRNHTISLDISDNLICSFEKKQIYNVITNILSNAIKYTPFSGKIEVKSEITDDFIIISIMDNGIGFSNEEKTQIFKQFGKIERYGQGYDVLSEGSGLGLYISKKIIEMHGGGIWVESEGREKGSTFYFSLPII